MLLGIVWKRGLRENDGLREVFQDVISDLIVTWGRIRRFFLKESLDLSWCDKR